MGKTNSLREDTRDKKHRAREAMVEQAKKVAELHRKERGQPNIAFG